MLFKPKVYYFNTSDFGLNMNEGQDSYSFIDY